MVSTAKPAVAAKPTKASKAKASAGPKKPMAHPPYSVMIEEAIVALKERTGSSQHAITKFIEDKQKAHLAPTYKKLVLAQLKKLVAAGKLTKIKNSFKLAIPAKKAPSEKTKKAPAKKAATKPKAAAPAKPKKAAAAKPAAKKPKTATKVATPKKKVAKPAVAKVKKTPAKAKVVKKAKSIKTSAKKAGKK